MKEEPTIKEMEQIKWNKLDLPEPDRDVLICIRKHEAGKLATEVVTAYLHNSVFYDINNKIAVTKPILYWAYLPKGPIE